MFLKDFSPFADEIDANNRFARGIIDEKVREMVRMMLRGGHKHADRLANVFRRRGLTRVGHICLRLAISIFGAFEANYSTKMDNLSSQQRILLSELILATELKESLENAKSRLPAFEEEFQALQAMGIVSPDGTVPKPVQECFFDSFAKEEIERLGFEGVLRIVVSELLKALAEGVKHRQVWCEGVFEGVLRQLPKKPSS